jgi:hypothetical protein
VTEEELISTLSWIVDLEDWMCHIEFGVLHAVFWSPLRGVDKAQLPSNAHNLIP